MPVEIKATAPPAGNARQSSATPTPAKAQSRKTRERAEGLNGIAGLVQFGLNIGGLHRDSAAIGLFFEPVSLETAKLAETNEKLGEGLDALAVIGPFAALLTALTPLVMQTLVNHDVLKVPANNPLGVMSKATLDAKLEMASMVAELEELENQRAMQEQVQAMRDDVAKRKAALESTDAGNRPA